MTIDFDADKPVEDCGRVVGLPPVKWDSSLRKVPEHYTNCREEDRGAQCVYADQDHRTRGILCLFLHSAPVAWRQAQAEHPGEWITFGRLMQFGDTEIVHVNAKVQHVPMVELDACECGSRMRTDDPEAVKAARASPITLAPFVCGCGRILVPNRNMVEM